MAAAIKSHSERDLIDWQFRLIDQQVTRHVQPPLHDVGMWSKASTLAECAFEMTSADPGKRRQLAQFDRLTGALLSSVRDRALILRHFLLRRMVPHDRCGTFFDDFCESLSRNSRLTAF
jgi:hypothetical protein